MDICKQRNHQEENVAFLPGLEVLLLVGRVVTTSPPEEWAQQLDAAE